MLLAIDTSTTLTGIACYDEEGLLGESVWLSGRNHTAQVLPQLHVLLRHIGRDRGDVKAIAVALGPGSWSGLRTGMSIAKGMALAGGLALLGVGTLDALAFQHRHPTLPVYPLIRLGRGHFATAGFLPYESPERQSADRRMTLEDLCAAIDGSTLFCGDVDADVQRQLRQALGDAALFPSPAANLRRPGFLAELAWQRFLVGERDDLARLEPIYLGEPVRKAI